jgi:thioredoxin 1
MVTRNEENIDSLLEENSKVIVLFGATWCMPCKNLKPKFQKVSLENSDIIFAYCDIEETQTLTESLKIQSVPTVVSFLDGIEDETAVGPSIDRVKEMVNSLRSRVNKE